MAPVVRMESITKRFGALVANDRIDFSLEAGETHALVGENGAGKTTLMRILYGQYAPDAGKILINGEPCSYHVSGALKHGIGMVHQNFMQIDHMSITENIILGHAPTRADFIDYRAAKEKIRGLLARFGMQKISPDTPIGNLCVGERQKIEIIKALYLGARVLILDEPTAVLTPQETEKLFAVLRNMRNDGKSIVIITHKMHEVESLSDRVAVLRRGCFVGDMMTKDTNAQEMTDMMVGHKVTLNITRPEPVNPQPRLEVKGLTVRSEEGIVKLKDVSFTAYSGEILGIAGISGCGQKELLEAIAGLQPTESGSVVYIEEDGTREELLGKDPQKIMDLGVSLSFVPEDRLGMGLVGDMDLTDNMMLRSFRSGHSMFTDRKTPKKLAKTVVNELEVSTPGLSTPVRRLSGGNVQKVLVGREISSDPTVLMTAYAVRGLDINSSYTIYNLINAQKEKGVAVIFVGEDLDVLLELSDRILVLCGGEVSGIVDGRTADKNTVGMMMTRVGGTKNEQ